MRWGSDVEIGSALRPLRCHPPPDIIRESFKQLESLITASGDTYHQQQYGSAQSRDTAASRESGACVGVLGHLHLFLTLDSYHTSLLRMEILFHTQNIMGQQWASGRRQGYSKVRGGERTDDVSQREVWYPTFVRIQQVWIRSIKLKTIWTYRRRGY